MAPVRVCGTCRRVSCGVTFCSWCWPPPGFSWYWPISCAWRQRGELPARSVSEGLPRLRFGLVPKCFSRRDSDMAERDLLWMSAVVFIPSVFALLLIFVPRGKEEIMRWLSLAGTGLTLGVSIGMFIAFYSDIIDRNGARGGDPRSREWVSL